MVARSKDKKTDRAPSVPLFLQQEKSVTLAARPRNRKGKKRGGFYAFCSRAMRATCFRLAVENYNERRETAELRQVQVVV